MYCLPHWHMASIMGYKDRPLSDRLYSTLGGIWGYSVRITRPSASISFNWLLSVL